MFDLRGVVAAHFDIVRDLPQFSSSISQMFGSYCAVGSVVSGSFLSGVLALPSSLCANFRNRVSLQSKNKKKLALIRIHWHDDGNNRKKKQK